MIAPRIHLAVWCACTVIACGQPGAERGEEAPPDASAGAADIGPLSSRCYRSSQSVLLGPITAASRQNGKGPGWIRIERFPAADSGGGELVDANRAGLGGSWRRGSRDSVLMAAADDFLRVELRLALSDTAAKGVALARSDADHEPDSTGQLRDFRREWILRAARAPCDSMPMRWTGKS
jgi:hypothetical protein